MKIKQITAHLVETNIESIVYNIVGPYWRIEQNKVVTWMHRINLNDPSMIYPPEVKAKLEQEFKDTYNVIHEQLELFNE